ncbi:Hypothetical protein HVR_LOCUS410 [uncultured virus]|nr:Hypothetical protein HVR_LOCUS410 [uncultured virus]
MSHNISIVQIDQNPGNWISQFLVSNGQPVTNTIQDKITTLYLLQHAKLLAPISLDDILKISQEFIRGIVLANNQPDQGDKINRLVALVLLYNLGAVKADDHQYINNPRFNEVFLSDINQQSTADVIRYTLTLPQVAKPFVTTPQVTTPQVAKPFVTIPQVSTPQVAKPFVTTPQIAKPFVATPQVSTPQVAKPFVATPQVAKPFVTTPQVPAPQVSTPQIIVEGNYKYRICQQCQAHIYNDEGICKLCDDDELFPQEILEEIQVENYIDTDPNYIDPEDYYDDYEEYEKYDDE